MTIFRRIALALVIGTVLVAAVAPPAAEAKPVRPQRPQLHTYRVYYRAHAKKGWQVWGKFTNPYQAHSNMLWLRWFGFQSYYR